MAATLWAHLHAWSLRRLVVKNYDLGVHVYHDKTTGVKDDMYSLSRQKWEESRGVLWTLRNKRPERLKDCLTEVEDLIQAFQIVQVNWISARFVQILLSNCALVSFMVAKNSGDVEKIFIDKSLCGKITDKIDAGIWAEDFMLLSFCDKPKLCCINFARNLPTDFRRLEKLVALDMKATFIDLPGQSGRRLNRCLSLNTRKDMVSVWWSLASEEAWPWSPVAGDRARANVVIVRVKGGKFDDLAYLRTDCDPIYVSFSSQNPNHILTIESTPKNEGDHTVDSCVYEFNKNAVKRDSAVSIPLKAAVTCLAWNKAEDKLLMGCKDKTLILYDCHRLVTQIRNIRFIPSRVSWHPAGSVIFIFSSQGDIQVFDMALAPLRFQLATERPSSDSQVFMFQMSEYFRGIKLSHAEWSCDSPLNSVMDGDVSCNDNLFMVFQDGSLLCNLRVELGSLSLGRLGPQELIEEYIKHDQAEQAVNFVNSINWNADGNSCFVCLSAVMNYLLKSPLTDDREVLLEETLGCFYTPSRPINDVVVLQYRDPLSRYSRRFFYHLLRHKKFQKAFMLAVDIGAGDLFMDIHFVALDAGNISLAENAKNKALEIDSELLSTDTDSSSGVGDDASIDDQDFRIENSFLNDPRVNIALGNQNGIRNDGQVLVEQTEATWQERNAVDRTDDEADLPDGHQSNAVLPINTNITQNPDVWALANNIDLVTTENEDEDVIYL
ncbi:WD repeat-containing and planar cell polarity effector protein fritz homolog [Dendronephthya gigantea]|uniref:WD repeat-containing and planar cell polarity effector protein fritz homolog n=1 Tax=Dendronephthya gigantea TaxID=151771 RepID=UPI00106A104D|nr:WD repeat-containing and planar cell polarity effector protein fritz homolog [Dendronephthya gigantea]